MSEKVRLYNQALLRYNEMTKTRAAKPTPVVVMKANTVDNEAAAPVETAAVGQSTEPANIVGTLPKTLQEKGRQLLSRLSTVAWNERGELMQKVWRYTVVTRSISFTIYCETEKRSILSGGVSSPTKCAPPTYPWNWSATLLGDDTCRNAHLLNEVESRNLLFRRVGNRTDRNNVPL